jgi:hypothetical protein
VDTDRVREIEAKIAELERRLPAHSVPPAMLQQLEELEIELEQERAAGDEEENGGQVSPS